MLKNLKTLQANIAIICYLFVQQAEDRDERKLHNSTSAERGPLYKTPSPAKTRYGPIHMENESINKTHKYKDCEPT